ncbi:MAG: cobyrinate a,c-diamide synthase [Roseateles depolymerans]|uniref:Cobyrinate a,c-diamide synthase n=1 Tax=Roseateles depolymerans TaxID=76731 RepID=A0A2W5DN24_9BURK|nr:MAG: cobyrinate a,c-diamide synthase [Roseateles depolymerans]
MNTVPALMISAPASGQGKTSVTAAIARAEVRRGRRVRVFKTGPDYLDPMILARASGQPVYQLDLFMGGLAHCQALLAEAANEADLILVEGVMGLFDGEPSSADLAAAFGLPVLAVLDASAMAQTFAALATGLARFRPDVRVAGVVANRVGSDYHAQLVADGLPQDLPLVAALKRQSELSLPERHLGLVQALELPALDAQLDAWADAWEAGCALGQGLAAAAAPVPLTAPPAADLGTPLAGTRIAVADDACFSFIYPANLDLLRQLGAEVLRFSPLAGHHLPPCDALWLPGGYPELHAPALQQHPTLFADLRAHLAAGKPLLAECGGMLVLLDRLTDVEGGHHAMAGLMPGEAQLQPRLAALGLQSLAWPEGPLRGHSFHYSTLSTPLTPVAIAHNPNAGRTAEPLYLQGSLRASYVHHYFPSHPEAVAAFFLNGNGHA